MNTVLECEQTLLVQADFDGELDAAQAAALVRHREECAQCRAVEEKLVRARALLRAAPRYSSSPELRERLGRALSERARSAGERQLGENASLRGDGARSRSDTSLSSDERSDGDGLRGFGWGASGASARPPRASRWSWRSSAGWAAAAAVALVAVIVSVGPPRSADVGAQLVNNHVRAMQLDSHLIDVVSTDHHTVKPWFAGKADFAPPVKQLDAEGYVLKGGRIDVVDARTAAVLVYQAGRHTVEVFIWPAGPESGSVFPSQQLNGFNLRHWEEGGFEVWCVSDMAAAELDNFASRWRTAS
jgi:anti-sigma factor RsiW